MDPDLDAGLFGIHLSDSEDGARANGDAEPAEGAPPKRDDRRVSSDRTAQSEEEFEAVRKGYVVKVENGEIWKTIKLPLGTGRISKPDAQALLHAVEELYFFRRYAEGARFVRAVLGESNGSSSAPGLDDDTGKLLRYYEKRCNDRSKEGEKPVDTLR
ncbi:hypothetical protein GGR52DRAFT_570405 [Hypoxylon sp. FL1284]|nr:hypothetical protein GGR52DRAFT_570405 [Hypoxylon sp. FL1284]